MAVLLFPADDPRNAQLPTATLLQPETLKHIASKPTAVLQAPVAPMDFKELRPTETLLLVEPVHPKDVPKTVGVAAAGEPQQTALAPVDTKT